MVDDFGIKVLDNVHANHPVSTLKKYYEVTVDWKGQIFVGIQLKWDCEKQTLDTHVPGFIPSESHKYQHKTPSNPQHATEKAAPIQYGAKVQTTTHDTLPCISAERIRRIQEVVGTFAWYLRTVDPNMATTMSSIASRKLKGTEKLEEEVK